MRFGIVLSLTIMTCSMFILFGFLNILKSKPVAGITEGFVGLLVLIFNLYFLKRKKRYRIPRTIINSITIAMSLYLYWSGGFSGTGIFWLSVLPGLYISTGGVLMGGLWMGTQLILLFLIYILSRIGVLEGAYSGSESLAALAVYTFSAYIFFSYELSRNRYRKEINVLEGLLPICSYCKKIRDKKGHWHQMENYLNDEADIDFSHGICPDCMSVHHPEYKRRK